MQLSEAKVCMLVRLKQICLLLMWSRVQGLTLPRGVCLIFYFYSRGTCDPKAQHVLCLPRGFHLNQVFQQALESWHQWRFMFTASIVSKTVNPPGLGRRERSQAAGDGISSPCNGRRKDTSCRFCIVPVLLNFHTQDSSLLSVEVYLISAINKTHSLICIYIHVCTCICTHRKSSKKLHMIFQQLMYLSQQPGFVGKDG